VLEGILYGLSLIMFGATLYIIFSEPTWSKSSRIMLPASILFFIYSTMHIALDMDRLVEAFVKNRLTEEGPTGFLDDVSIMTNIYKNAIYGLHTFLGDLIVIYRAYMVWRKIWVAIVPSLLVAGTMTCSWSILVQFGRVKNATGDILFGENMAHWVTGFFATSLAANFLATGLLGYKIWMIEHEVAPVRVGRGAVKHVLRVIADSGALYSASMIALMICYVVRSNAQYILLDMMMPIISIAFYMIILRLALARRRKRLTTMARSTTARSEPIPMRRLHIKLQQDVETMADADMNGGDKESQTY